jgi:uncharacterized Tic20 family protein
VSLQIADQKRNGAAEIAKQRSLAFVENKPHASLTMETTQPSPGSTSSAELRTWNVLCHASALLGFFFPWAGHVIAPLIVWLVKRGDSPEIDAHGKESINFQLSMLVYSAISAILCLVLVGFVLLAILHILNVVLVIIASIRASEGKFYRYPITIRFLS